MDSSPPTKHSTSDSYQRLLELEVKNLLSRVTELTNRQDQIFDEFTRMLTAIEEVVGKLQQTGTTMAFHRSEIELLRKAVSSHEHVLQSLSTRISSVETQLQNLDPVLLKGISP
jgi:chromosome segregation ATPase